MYTPGFGCEPASRPSVPSTLCPTACCALALAHARRDAASRTVDLRHTRARQVIGPLFDLGRLTKPPLHDFLKRSRGDIAIDSAIYRTFHHGPPDERPRASPLRGRQKRPVTFMTAPLGARARSVAAGRRLPEDLPDPVV